jgi:septum formation topological specificity factor MinE
MSEPEYILIPQERSKYNVKNGLIGLNRDILIHLTKYFKNDADIVEV